MKRSIKMTAAKTVSLITAVMMLFIMTAVTGTVVSAAPSVNSTNVSVFFLADWEKEYLTLPAECKESFQLKVSGASNVSYRASGSGINVSSSGLITPNVTTYYWYGNVGYSYKLEGSEPDDITHSIKAGTYSVTVTADAAVFEVKVTLYDYGEYYAGKTMDDFVRSSIKSDMTTEQKLDAIAKFVASKEYDASYSSSTGMLVSGGGDCWASTYTIIELAKRCGFDAWVRNGNRDAEAGSGHKNAMVYDGKNHYEIEAGYYEAAPRSYFVTKRTSLFSYSYDNDGICVYQYDGKTVPSNFIIPDTINGKKVVSIGKSFISAKESVEHITLPETLRTIGESAFNSCKNLKSINIPASVTDIGTFAFVACYSLTDINASGNYSFEGGALYKNDGTLICAPNAKSVTIKSGTKNIKEYAFYYNNSVSRLTIPQSVETIGEGAFGDCSSLTKLTILGKGLKTIDDFAFAYSGLKYVELPESVTSIGQYLYYGLSEFTLIGKKGSAVETYAKDNNVPFVDAYGTKALSIALKVREFTLTAGYEKTLQYDIVPSTVNDPVTWKSSNTAVATVSGGKVKAVSAGTATITAKTASGVQDVCTITVVDAPLQNKSTVSAETITLGKSVKITAAASGGKGGYTYAVYYKKASSDKYSLVKDFTSGTSFAINPKAAVAYNIKVIAKDSSGKQSSKVFNITVKKPLTNDSSLSSESIKLGGTVRVTAKASGGTAPYTYGVYYKKASSEKWFTLQNYSSKTSVNIKPASAVKYDVCVKVRDSTGKIVKKYFTVSVKK